MDKLLSRKELTLATNSVPPMRQYGFKNDTAVVSAVTCPSATFHRGKLCAAHHQHLQYGMPPHPRPLPHAPCPHNVQPRKDRPIQPAEDAEEDEYGVLPALKGLAICNGPLAGELNDLESSEGAHQNDTAIPERVQRLECDGSHGGTPETDASAVMPVLEDKPAYLLHITFGGK
jgi:hypothetical protein